jgi:cyclase
MESTLMPRRSAGCLALAAGLLQSVVASSAPAGPEPVKIATGVYQFISPDIAGNVDGNSIAILTDHDVLMFDTNLLPSAAQHVMDAVRAITPMPVRYVVNSHWHPDHAGGNELYARQFPDLEIIASQETRRLMQDTAKVYVKTLEFEAAQADQEVRKMLKIGMGSDGKPLSPHERQELQAQIQQQGQFLAEYKSDHVELPTLTFGDNLTLYHGGREFRLMRLAGHTLGDVALYLPADKILLTGDLLVYPVPFCADSHPTAWIASLQQLSQLDAVAIVPGHGAAQYDASYLRLVFESLQNIQAQVRAAVRNGLTLQAVQQSVNLDAVRRKFTHDDPDLNALFQGNFVPIVRQMYDEATEGLELYQ